MEWKFDVTIEGSFEYKLSERRKKLQGNNKPARKKYFNSGQNEKEESIETK